MKITDTKKYVLLLLISLIVFGLINNLFNFNMVPRDPSIRNFYYPLHKFVKMSIIDFHQFPHWIPYYFGGTPLWANSQNTVFSIPVFLSLIMPSIESSTSFTIILFLFFSGVFTYYMALELGLKPKHAFIAGLIFMYSYPARVWIQIGASEYWDVYIWMPLIFFFCLKALKSKEVKNYIKYSMLSGFFAAVSFHSGNHQMFLFIVLFIGIFLVYRLIINVFDYKKILVVGLVIVFVCGGLVAVKMLPMLEFSKLSSVSSGRGFEDARASYMQINGLKDIPIIFTSLITKNYNFPHSFDVFAVGVFAVLLSLVSLIRWKNKNILFFWIAIIIIYVIATNKTAFYVLWKFVPGFDKQHHIGRILYLVPISIAILAGYGSSYLEKLVKKSNMQKYNFYISFAVILLVLLSLEFFHPLDQMKSMNIEEEVQLNYLYQNLSSYPGVFRIHNIKTDVIGWPAVGFAVPLKMQILQGAINVWIPEYLNTYFYFINQDPAKFYGILNTKYLYSDTEVNISGLKFVQKFKECEACLKNGPVWREDGPYLYENELFLPRAYFVNNSILVVGNKNDVVQTTYALMLNQNFNPSNTVIIMGEDKKINDYEQEFLNRFSAIFLTQGSVDENSMFKLKNYVESNGILIPNIVEGENSVSIDKVEEILSSFDGDYSNVKEVSIPLYTPNKVQLNLNKSYAFLVLSEKYFMFDGWKLKIDGKANEILRANAMNSAAYVSSGKTAIFEYQSAAFKIGAVISAITMLIMLVLLILWRK